MDRLETIFALQRSLQGKLGYRFKKDLRLRATTDEQVATYIKHNVLMCTHELHELLTELPFFKPWKVYEEWNGSGFDPLVEERLLEELVDALHFYINIALALGITPSVLFNAYCEKNVTNRKRQQEDDYQKEKRYIPYDAKDSGGNKIKQDPII